MLMVNCLLSFQKSVLSCTYVLKNVFCIGVFSPRVKHQWCIFCQSYLTDKNLQLFSQKSYIIGRVLNTTVSLIFLRNISSHIITYSWIKAVLYFNISFLIFALIFNIFFISLIFYISFYILEVTAEYSKPCPTSKIEHFGKIVDGFHPLTIFSK